MSENIKKTNLVRFDQMAFQVKAKVEPKEANVDIYVGLEHLDSESLKIRRWGEPKDVESSKILFQSGDIIFGKRRAYQKKLAVAEFNGICSAHAMVLRPKTDVITEEFLPFFMQSDIFMDRAVKISVGGLSPTINWRDLAKEKFILPLIDDQRRISEVLLASQRCKEKITNTYIRLNTLKISLIEELMSRGIPNRHKTFKKTEIGDLPSGWDVVTLESVLKRFQNGYAFSSKGYASEGVPIITMANISLDGKFQIDHEKMRYWPKDKEINLDNYQIDNGDLLIAMTDVTPDQHLIGRMALVNVEGPFFLNQRVGHLILDNNLIDRRFLMNLSQGSFWRRYAISHAGQGTQSNLSTEDIKSAFIPLPPIGEQIEIANYLSLIDDRLADLKNRENKVDNLRKSLIKECLS